LNLTEVSQVDSSGFSVIVQECVSLREKGDLRIIRPTGRALMAFNIT